MSQADQLHNSSCIADFLRKSIGGFSIPYSVS